MTSNRTRSSKAVVLGLTVFAAATITACGTPDKAAICVDPQTDKRVSDSRCDSGENPRDYDGVDDGFFWWYVATNSGYRVPAVGSSYEPSQGTYNGRGLVSKGQSVQRGGVTKTGGSSFKSVSKSSGFGSSKGVSSS